jgi:hypothetical protein
LVFRCCLLPIRPCSPPLANLFQHLGATRSRSLLPMQLISVCASPSPEPPVLVVENSNCPRYLLLLSNQLLFFFLLFSLSLGFTPPLVSCYYYVFRVYCSSPPI